MELSTHPSVHVTVSVSLISVLVCVLDNVWLRTHHHCTCSVFFSIAVIPDTPHIAHIEFVNGPIAAVLQWTTNDSSVNLIPHVRLCTHNGPWVK